jgi:hypothetical protein
MNTNMLAYNFDSKRTPFGGHHFPQYGNTFRANSLKELVTIVEDFRISNNIPAGQPEQDILAFYADNWPWLVKSSKASDKEIDPNYLAWREWIYETWRKPPVRFITTKEASARWEKCKECKFNLKLNWEETKESSELQRRAFILRRGIDAPDYLGFCALHKADLSAFTFFDAAKSHSGVKTDETFDGCWLFEAGK